MFPESILILNLLWETDDLMSSRLTALDMLSILPGTLRNRSIFIHTLLPISSSTFMQVSPLGLSGFPERSFDDGAARAIEVYGMNS
jgi:hypothetical protein